MCIRDRFFGVTGAKVPPPLSSFSFHRAISLADLELGASSASNSAESPEHSIYDLSCRRLAGQFQAAEAAKCGCGVPDIAWYPTTRITVAEGRPPQHTTAVHGNLVCAESSGAAAGGQMLSFSTTFNSGPCIAAFMLMYVTISLDTLLADQALEILEGAEAGALQSLLCLGMCIHCWIW